MLLKAASLEAAFFMSTVLMCPHFRLNLPDENAYNRKYCQLHLLKGI